LRENGGCVITAAMWFPRFNLPDSWRRSVQRHGLPALAALLAAYALALGDGTEWSHQMGSFWARLPPWLGSLRADFLALAALAFVAALVLQRWRHGLTPLLAALLIGGQVACGISAWALLRGGIPWGVDYPSFMFRLHEFAQVFPLGLGSYNPWWNAGVEHFTGVTSGVHNFGILNWPLFKFWPIHQVHGYAVAFWIIFGFPWLGVISARSAGIGWAGALCAGLLLCIPTRALFLFGWQSGNVGSMTATLLVLPLLALGYRLVVLRKGGVVTALLLALTAWLVALWSPGVFAGVGLALGWLWSKRRWSAKSSGLFIAAGVLAVALLLPWLWVTFFPYRSIVDYVGTSPLKESWLVCAQTGAGQLWRRILEMHPVVAVLGLLGAFFVAPRGMRRWALPTALVLVAVTVSIGWKRQSQLDRVALMLAVVAVLPAAALCGRILRRPCGGAAGGGRRRWGRLAMQAVLLAVLVMGQRTAYMHIGNRGGFKLWMMAEPMQQMVQWLRDELPPESRVAIAGTADEWFDWGTAAYLPILTGHEMLADDYYGFPRGLIARNFPPHPYNKTYEGWLEFERIYAIAYWLAAEGSYRGQRAMQLFDEHPEHFKVAQTFIIQGRRIVLYEVLEPAIPARLFKGTGTVAASENLLRVEFADEPEAETVLRYNWRDGLYCKTPGASIGPYPAGEHTPLIAVTPGEGQRAVEIGYRPGWHPLRPGWGGVFHH